MTDLSVIILVASVVIVGFISINQSEVINNKFFKNSNNFGVLYSSMAEYVRTNKKLPCPASLTDVKNSSSTYGVAATDSNCVLAGVYQSNSNSNLVYGMIPTKTLGLDNSASEDSYGNKIFYIVDKRLTQAGDSFETNIMNSSVINIADRGINDAIFVFLSRGENSLAAFNANSNQITSASSNVNEAENDLAITPGSSTTANFNNVFYQSSSTNGFDDLLFYKNYEQFFNDYNLWDLIPCSSSSSSESLYNTIITWPKAYPNQTVVANTSCPEGFQGGVAAPTKKCGNKGVWGSVVENCIESALSNVCSVNIVGSTTVSVSEPVGSFECDESGYSGAINYTCEDGVFETFNACAIVSEATGENCTGGNSIDTTSVAGSTIHIFTSNGTLICSSTKTAQILVVGGGGGGGKGGGGGGGAGGLVYDEINLLSDSYTINVGSGGIGGTTTSSPGSNGVNSSLIGNSVSITAYGGGGGGPIYYVNPSSGGSGGGAGSDACSRLGGSATMGIGASAFGNSGGNSGGCGHSGGAGGGGAKTGGESTINYSSSSLASAGDGGQGMMIPITGSDIFYAGGGGGGYHNNANFGAGGLGGGGSGGGSSSVNPTSGTNGLGGGGGGGKANGNGGNGGSGIVIVRYGAASNCPTGYNLSNGNCIRFCSVSVTGVSSPSTINAGSGNLTCNATGYSGSVAYSCDSGGVLSTSTSCSCATGHTGADCQTCASGYTKVNGVCTLGCSTGSTVGIITRNVNAGTGTLNCNATNFNTADSINYSCSNNVFSITSGACDSCTSGYTFASNSCQQNCTINGVTGITNGTAVNHGSTSIACNASNYTGTINYTCSNGTFTQTSGSCTLIQNCTGGTITSVSGQTVHTFTSNGTLSCPASKTGVRILVVAGGGSGGTHPNNNGTPSGGGGGGVIYGGNVSLPSGNYNITIGVGGSRVGSTNCSGLGVSGSNTTFTSSGINLTAAGGGGGNGCNFAQGLTGGSSGGSNSGSSTAVTASTISGLSGLSQFGQKGGSNYAGGGGASAQGAKGTSTTGGAGGQGYSSDISGSNIIYGSGGGGAATTGGVGGTNAGNGSSNGGAPTSGVANRGGGGGGANGTRAPGSGGSGVVIIRY
jgi:hypothetical protein